MPPEKRPTCSVCGREFKPGDKVYLLKRARVLTKEGTLLIEKERLICLNSCGEQEVVTL